MTDLIKLTCIGCPLGCQISVNLRDGAIEDISGYTCRRGLEYARSEVTEPVRTITSTVRVNGGKRPVVAVKTKSPIPKDKIQECMDIIFGLSIDAPVAIGDVVCDNIAGTGVDLVASACD